MALIPRNAQAPHTKRTATSVRLAVLLLSALTLTAALAGCTADREDDDNDNRNVSLSYEGEETGSHSDVANCNEDGLITSTGAIENGNLTITVTDGAGDTIYEETLNGTLTGDSEGINGESGDWTVEVTREGDFNGQYVINLGC